MNHSTAFSKSKFSEHNIPMVNVKFSLESSSGELFSDTLPFLVDSGFDGLLKLPVTYASSFSSMGIPSTNHPVRVASGSARALLFHGKIDKIQVGNTFLNLTSSITGNILCMGNESNPPLIGLAALSKWTVCLDLPKKILSFS